MKIRTILKGGIGNQMFQYATARSLAKKYNGEVCLGISSYNDQSRKYPFPLSITNYNISVVKDTIMTYKIINESYYHYNHTFEYFDPAGMDVVISGYWQCEQYFKDIKDILVDEFVPKVISPRVHDYLDKFSQCNAYYTIAVHIRRGERAYEEEAMKIHGLIPWSYYEEAFNVMKDGFVNDKLLFVIFSDDIEYARKNYNSFPGKILYIEPGPDHEDLYLMSKCDHAIIANSSFSWWGAWLMQNKTKIIISPDMWVKNPEVNTKDVIPERWIKLYTKLV